MKVYKSDRPDIDFSQPIDLLTFLFGMSIVCWLYSFT